MKDTSIILRFAIGPFDGEIRRYFIYTVLVKIIRNVQYDIDFFKFCSS